MGLSELEFHSYAYRGTVYLLPPPPRGDYAHVHPPSSHFDTLMPALKTVYSPSAIPTTPPNNSLIRPSAIVRKGFLPVLT